MQRAFPDYNEVKITPVIAENADISNLTENGDETHDGIVAQLKEAYTSADGLDEEMTSIMSSLEGYTGEDFDKIIFGDGKV